MVRYLVFLRLKEYTGCRIKEHQRLQPIIETLTILFFTLRRYEGARKLRVAIIHGLARMAAIMASTYKAYLGVGLGPLSVSFL